MDSKKILIVSSVGTKTPPTATLDGKVGISYGGAELVTYQISKLLAKEGHQVSLVASLDSEREYLDSVGIEFLPTVKSAIIGGIPENESYAIWKERIKGRKYDIIIDQTHRHHTFMEQSKNPEYPPVIHVFHDDLRGTQTKLPESITAPRICGVSFNHAGNLNQVFGLQTCRALHHGIDLDQYQLYEGQRNGRALVVNRVQWFKGIWEAIQICQMAGIGLDVVGPLDHQQGDWYIPFSKQWERDGKVVFHGEVPQEKKVEMMQKASVGISVPNHCVPPGAMVTTNPGQVPIEQVQVGERILAHDGNYHETTGHFANQYDGDLVSLSVSGLPTELTLTPEHRVWGVKIHRCTKKAQAFCRWSPTCDKLPAWPGYSRKCTDRWFESYRPEWAPIGEFGEGDFVVIPSVETSSKTHIRLSDYKTDRVKIVKGKLYPMKKRRHSDALIVQGNGSPVRNEIPITPELGEFCGYYAAEGCAGYSALQLTFGKSNEERRFAKRAASLGRRIFGVRSVVKKRADGIYIVYVTSTILTTIFREWFGHKATSKHLPRWLMESPVGVIRAFHAGYLNGDGCSTIRNGKAVVEARTASPVLAEQVALMSAKVGLCPYARTFTQGRGSHAAGRPIWGITYTGSDVHHLWSWGVKNHGGEAPKRTYWRYAMNVNGDLWLKVLSTKRARYTGPVYNLEVKKANSYRVGWVPVHNCEAFGLSVAETEACGTPMVTNTSGALPELVPNENACRDMMRAVRRVREIIENDKYGPRDYRAIVEKDYSLQRMLSRYRTVIEDALADVSW